MNGNTAYDVALSVLIAFVGVVALALALALLAWAFTWLSILYMRWTDPKAYERFRIIHNLRKGAWKRR